MRHSAQTHEQLTMKTAITLTCLYRELVSVLYYGLEARPVNRNQVRSLDYAVHDSCFMKIFSTTDQSVIEQCMIFF